MNMKIEVLKDLEEDSLRRKIPIIGYEEGKWLLEFIQEKRPKRILELGTANGYSGIILGSEGAELTTIEIDWKIAEEAKKNFEKFGINAKIIIGDGVEEIKKLDGKFDLIFIDFANKKYIQVLEDCIRLCKKGGFIIGDNVFLEGCKEFLEAVQDDKRLETELIKIRKGISVSKVSYRYSS
jgi:predicted O-methyltransferase YrrM